LVSRIRFTGSVFNPPYGASLSRGWYETDREKAENPQGNICQERVKKLNESKPLDDVSKITFTILKTMCGTVTWDKDRDYQLIGCLGIRH
jgi:hypothetical protein